MTTLQNYFLHATKKNIPEFMKLFWNEQQKYINTSKHGLRYHPMVIRFCLNLASKSSAAYDEIRYEQKGTGFLVLPSRRRLQDFRNYITPQQGFNHEIIKELCDKTSTFTDAERFVIVTFDEMKIQEDLVWDKHSGNLIGYVDLGNIETNYATLQNNEHIASHVLVFLIRSVVNPIKFTLENFATTGATSCQMFPLFWKAVSILEYKCNLKVVAATSDGASANRKLYRMHIHMNSNDTNGDIDAVYKVMNIHSGQEKRYIYFLGDPPHIVKTARNCLANSGSGRATRYMWNDNLHLLWSHISSIFYEDMELGLKQLPKLTSDHINLTPYSAMNVSLAAQVLSSTVASVLNASNPDAPGAAKFCELMDSFFDCANVRNSKECMFKQKKILKPYTDVDDEQFMWLLDVFLKYFDDWKTSIDDRPGNFTRNARSNMFISWQTHESLKITCHSLVGLI